MNMNWLNEKSLDKFFGAINKFLVMLSDFFIVLTQTIFTKIGAFLILVFAATVEYFRIAHGIKLFESNPILISLAAASTVLFLVAQDMIIIYREHKSGYKKPVQYRNSVQLLKQRLHYLFSDELELQEKSPAQSFINASGFVKGGVVTISLLGSMDYVFYEVLNNQSQNLYLTVLSAIINGNGEVIFPLLTGTLFTLMIVTSVSNLSKYVAYQAIEIENKYHETIIQDRVEENEIETLNSRGKENLTLTKKTESIDSGTKLIYQDDEGNKFIAMKDAEGQYVLKSRIGNDVTSKYYNSLAELEKYAIRVVHNDLRKWKLVSA